ncbi:ISAs1 family transposase [Streptomyces anulatus]|uniref:ISAs1 family transposase n=1 Tax=Streptomyces anulatus TaxID=1892 RepID=UPI003658974E
MKLGPLDAGQDADLRPFLDRVPDPRARRGRWYSLTATLLVCAGAAVSGARSVDEFAEWAARASDTVLVAVGVRRHPLRWRRAPSRTTIGRVLAAVDGDALDQAVGAYFTARNTAGTASGKRQVIAVDGKSLRGSARLSAGRRHLLSAVTHHRALTLAQAEVGTKTNETAHFRPLLEPLDLDGSLVTFDALHSVKANVTWLVTTENAHYIAMIKRNQPTAYRQITAPPWPDIPVQHTASSAGHGRRESRSIKTCGIGQSTTNPNEPSHSWASPTTPTPRQLDQALAGSPVALRAARRTRTPLGRRRDSRRLRRTGRRRRDPGQSRGASGRATRRHRAPSCRCSCFGPR